MCLFLMTVSPKFSPLIDISLCCTIKISLPLTHSVSSFPSSSEGWSICLGRLSEITVTERERVQLSKPHSGTLHCFLITLLHTKHITLDTIMPHHLHCMCYDCRGFAKQEQVYSSCSETVNMIERLKIVSEDRKQLPAWRKGNFPLSGIQAVC